MGGLIAILGQPAEARKLVHYDSVVQLNGTAAGAYSEETRRAGAQLVDSVKQVLVLDRLGSRLSIGETDIYYEDPHGNLLGGHFESSSAKATLSTDLIVKAGVLELTNHAGDRAYLHNVPFEGTAVGPEGIRRLMRKIRSGAPIAGCQTFVSSLGGLARETLEFQGSAPVDIAGRSVHAFKYKVTIAGIPDSATFWTDRDGYVLRGSLNTPFGALTFVRGAVDAGAMAAGADLPTEVYEKTIAVSNIRLPHARKLDAITVEISKKADAADGWPDFAAPNQHVISETPRRAVLEITRYPVDRAIDGSPPTKDEIGPNSLIQSDLPEISNAAREAAAGETDPWQIALKLQAWTSRHMSFDAGIALAPASELIREKHGTCLGYSILLAALARAEGIPSRIRMGSAYFGDMWAGHAWVEVYTHGKWLPLDATLYYPGVADPARIAVTTETGASGSITGVGELARLYGKVEIHTLGYRLEGRATQVTPSAADHEVTGGTYRNPWLGLAVTVPPGLTFAELAPHWPSSVILSMKGPDGEVSINQFLATPDRTLAEQVKAAVASDPHFAKSGEPQTIIWDGHAAARLEVDGASAVAAMKDDQLWLVVAKGSSARRLLDRSLTGISISELKS